MNLRSPKNARNERLFSPREPSPPVSRSQESPKEEKKRGPSGDQIDQRIRKLKKCLLERIRRDTMGEQKNALSLENPYERLYEIAELLLCNDLDELEKAEKLLDAFMEQQLERTGPVMVFARRLNQICVQKIKEESEMLRVSEGGTARRAGVIERLEKNVARDFKPFIAIIESNGK